MIHFYPLEKALPKIQASIEQGEHLHKSMQNFSFFDSRMVYLVKVAEEINQLDQIFDRLQQQYYEDVEHRIKILNNLLEPLLIIIVGLIVGFILVAMYLPLFQLGGWVYINQ
nr:type II secretion system F family protein [Salinivirga cyanobacteriivorans]